MDLLNCGSLDFIVVATHFFQNIVGEFSHNLLWSQCTSQDESAE
jgi:hypothetical protein